MLGVLWAGQGQAGQPAPTGGGLSGGLTGGGPPPTTFVQLHPGQNTSLPGQQFLASLADAISSYALIAALIGVLIGAVMWAFGHYSQNYQQSANGRKGVLASGLAALLIGAAPFLINFFATQGGHVH